MLAEVWPGVVVEENNLQVQVSALRKILGPSAIATTAGRGYRFTLEMVRADELSSLTVTPRHNLPAQLTSFIGHDDDLEEYATLLDNARLLTLTGIGGCGKTRLALKLAERALPSFPDGVWFVDLAPLADAERLPLTVAVALGVRKQIDEPPIETLCKHLASRRALIVLDNCEHLNAACAELTQRLLGAAANLRILATSREGLNVPGERCVTVRSLGLPAIGSGRELAEIGSCEAIRLFVERARSSAARFSLDASTAPAVSEICRRLDGIPLAIELAATRVKVLSVEEIRTRLDDRFRLLTGGRGSAVGRQQTLLAAIQWSYDHLPLDEQRLLRLLSVFAGGWTLAAAVRVIGDPVDEYRVLDLLTGLVDRSLVTIEPIADGTTRYAMLETVRQHAQERLSESGEDGAARARHLEFFVALAAEAEAELSGRNQGAWIARLMAELENLLQAMGWCDQAENGAELGLRLAHTLRAFWLHAGLIEVGYRQTLAGLKRAGTAAPSRARALVDASLLGCNLHRFAETNEQALEALTIAREIGDPRLVAETVRILGYMAIERGDDASALALIEQALTAARDLNDQTLVARALNVKGEFYRAMGNMEAAQPLYEESLALARAEGNSDLVPIVSDNLARVFISRGQPERARPLVVEVLTVLLATASKWIGLCAFDVTAGLAAAATDWTFAARMRGAAEARVKTSKYARDRADRAFFATCTLRIREALDETAYAGEFDSGFALSDEQAVAEALAWLTSAWGPA